MLVTLLEILWWLQPAPAAGGNGGNGGNGGSAGAPGEACYTQIGLLAVMVLVFYFLLIRPQQKRERERESMLKSLKKGAMVRTSGGIRGEITDLTEQDVTLLVSDKTKLNVLRSHIAAVEGAEDENKAQKGVEKKG
ncbi:MAG: preprotein translocase subunit YajC [Myxococcota bacterium]